MLGRRKSVPLGLSMLPTSRMPRTSQRSPARGATGSVESIRSPRPDGAKHDPGKVHEGTHAHDPFAASCYISAARG